MNRNLLSTLLISGAIGLGAFTLSGKPVTPEGALARLTDSSHSAPGKVRNQLSKVRYIRSVDTEKGQPAIYLYNLSGKGGYLIAPADDRFMPLLGYSDAGDISEESLPEGLRWWLGEMVNEIMFATGSDEKSEGLYTPPSLGPAISPLVKSEWGQTSPYNLYTPVINDKQSPTGCVATALSQIMYYHQWPLNPKGEITYKDFSSPANTYSLTFDGMTFDWGIMKDIYEEGATDESAQAVSTLMKAVGYGTEMNYGATSSGTTDDCALTGMQTYFGYSSDGRLIHRESMMRNEWDTMIYTMLKGGMPVYYTGRDAVWLGSGGHAFVCDGYDGEGYFHFNWGWNGRYNGYFVTTCLVPAGAGTGGFINGYNYTQAIMVNLHPDNGEKYSIYDYVLGKDFALELGDANELTVSLETALPYEEYGLGISVSESGSEGNGTIFPLGTINDENNKWTVPAEMLNSLDKTNIYDLRLVWKKVGDESWKRVTPMSEGSLVFNAVPLGGYLSYHDDSWNFKVARMDQEPINVEITDVLINDEDFYISGSSNTISFIFKNLGNDYEFHATRCYAVDAEGEATLFFNTSLDVEPAGETVNKYGINNTVKFPEGEYTLVFINVNSLQIIPTDREYRMTVYDQSNVLQFDDGTFLYSVIPGYDAILTGTLSGGKAGGDIHIPSRVNHEGSSYIVGKMTPSLSSIIDKNQVTTLRIDLPITELPSSALSSCAHLTELYLPSTLRKFGKYACAYNKELIKIELPPMVDELGEYAFSGCSKLEHIDIPVVETIPSRCFYGMDALKEVNIPEGVKNISSSAFYFWEDLEKISLPSTLENIAEYVFSGFSSAGGVKEVSVNAMVPPAIQSNSFASSIYRTAALKVPKGGMDAYKADPNWSKFLQMEELPGPTGVEKTEGEIEGGEWFTIDGHRLHQRPGESGIYILVSKQGKRNKIIIR